MVYNYSFYGFINLDWTIPWVDTYNFRLNNAEFNNEIGTFTNTTLPIDSSNNLIKTIKPDFYNGTLDTINLYDSTGNSVFQNNNGILNYYELKYNTSQFGEKNFDNSQNSYIFPNRDTFNISEFIAYDSSGINSITITDFNISTDYNTKYFSNFDFDLSKSKGCNLPSTYNFISNYEEKSGFNFTYQLYYGSGIQIPQLLRTQFNISESESLNIFTNKYNKALYDNNNKNYTYYWQYFSNYYGNPENTGWIIANTIVE